MKTNFKQHLIAAALLGATALFSPSLKAELVADQLTLTPQYASEQPPASPETPTAAPADAAPDDQSGGNNEAAVLAKKLTNPIASLISVPFQFNYDSSYGPNNADKVTLNFQPVVPFSLNEDWNLIVRTIVPVVYQGSVADGVSSTYGLGDTIQSFFLSPKAPTEHGWIWGAGPVFLWPTGSDDSLSAHEWGAGPTAVFLRQDSGFTYGILANHIWSFASAGGKNGVSNTFLQPFLSYTWPTATTLSINTESTYSWTSKQWTVPINLTLSQVLRFGKLPVQFGIGPRYYTQSPDGGPEWGARFTVTFLFPK